MNAVLKDYCTDEGAQELALRVEIHWARKGYTVRTKREYEALPGRVGVMSVRSDMVGGLPRQHPIVNNSAAGQSAAAD